MQKYELYILHPRIAVLAWAIGFTTLCGLQHAANAQNTPAQTSRGTSAKFVKPSDSALHKMLTAIQYDVTQKDGTESPFRNAYWNNERAGIYVDIVSGEPLFSSLDKFDSGTGWPSFTKPLEPRNIIEKVDHSFGTVRTEVRSRAADSHLGHVFTDGPQPTGLRYCMNSAALRFIPADSLKGKGYDKYVALFKH
jgi:methionine-R-sulfoxide reductase